MPAGAAQARRDEEYEEDRRRKRKTKALSKSLIIDALKDFATQAGKALGRCRAQDDKGWVC